MRLYSGTRKMARATAAFRPGAGRVRVNNQPAELLQPQMARERILTPLELAGELRDKVDIDVRVAGGGYMGQAEAVAVAISRGLVDWFRKEELKRHIGEYDRLLLVGDPRQTESKKFGGPGARRRKQKSYR